jgi:putative SbcD/Mre11-related phosphoesterase
MNPASKMAKKTRKRSEESIGQPVHNQPAAVIKNPTDIKGDAHGHGNVLIVADLHYGIEYSLAQAGASLPSQTKQTTKRIIELCKKNKITELILVGDIKHTVPQTSRQEWHELPLVFEQLTAIVDKIDIIPGNHDGNLQRLVPKNSEQIRFHPSSGAVLHGLGFFHGHTWPDPKVFNTSQVFMAHNHPNVLFVDKLGGRASYSCWLRARLDHNEAKNRYPSIASLDPEILIMPAFNDIGSGTPVNSIKPEFLGPMLKNRYIHIQNARVYLLDGTALGRLGKLTKLTDITD